jgi:diguanylate cyclase (GGDEF)-like protein/PAS domain S-box-containing protein
MATVLVVDDRPSNRQFLTTLLGYSGHRLLEAGDGAEALRMIEASRPDLVITDILMPKMDGYELVQHLRARAEFAGLPVIFWTATYSASEAQQLALSCGVGKVLPKPCEPDVMLAAVGEALGAAPAEAPTAPESADTPSGPVSIDDSVSLYLKDLQAVRVKFDDIVKRGTTLRAERDRVRELSRQFSTNVTKLQRITAKLSALIEVGMEMTSERDPERLVKLFFAGACDIVDSKIAAAGVLDEQETSLRYVVAQGVDPVILREGAKPGGEDNFLVKLLAGHPPIRARSASSADDGGLPAGHPPVESFLGVPIASPERVYGWLYFANRKGAKSFTEEDERLALIMAQKLALVYEHALLYDVIQRHAAKLQIEVGERKRAETALRESEAGLRRAQIMARLAHVVTRPDGSFEQWSETLPVLAGLAPERMPRTTRDWLDLVHPEDRGLFRQTAIDAGSAGARRDVEYRLLRPDGEIAHIRQVTEPIEGSEDAHGRKRWFNTLQDVTHQKRAQETLRESELRFRQLAENIREVFFLTDPANSKILYVSPAYEAIWGRSCESLYRSAQSWTDLIHPEDQAAVIAGLEGSELTGELDEEYRIVREDGATRWIHARGFPIRDDSGNLHRVAGIAEDITERKQAAEELRESERRFRSLLGTVQLVSLMLDREARITYCNEYLLRLTGWKHEEVIGRDWFEVFLPPEQIEMRQAFADLIADQPSGWHHENEILTRDGKRRLILWNNTVLRSGSGEVIGTASIGEDITDRKAAEERVRRLNRVYAMLSGINTLIVRVRSRDELFREACRIAVEAGQFRLAWIGMVDRELRRVVPLAWAGDGEGFLERMPAGTDDATAPGGMVAQAIAERRPVISEDMARDPRILLKDEAAARDFHALALLPLIVSGEAQGALALYAAEIGFFDEEEMKLLNELAGDIAFALEHLEAISRVEYLAFHDVLTGLPNRAVLVDHLDILIRAARRERHLAGVVFFDIERFRMVNETLGRAAGDEMLKQVAERFAHATRADDTLARVGADVFAVAVAGFHGVKEATHYFTERLTEAFARPLRVDGQELRIALKAGVAVFPSDGNDAETLCRNAEAALKKAKESGERFFFYTPEINARVADSLAMENRLRGALEAGQFVLHYQPKVVVTTRALVGLEALIRWNDPQTGLVPPGKFIPLMEETGLILQAGRWALKQAVADIQAWRAKGYAPPRVAVNVSPMQLRQKDFVVSVLEALEGFGDADPLLDLEITESMVMQDLETTIRALQTLGGVGVETYLDDFGTGYSSLAYVARLPVVALKIDRSFVIEMGFSKYARTIVQTVVSLSQSLGLKVVAEGVDDEEQVKILTACGCDQMQGYLISKPVPAGEIEALLAKA